MQTSPFHCSAGPMHKFAAMPGSGQLSSFWLVLLLIAAGGLVENAQAKFVQFNFAGGISHVNGSEYVFPEGIRVGERFSGNIVYDAAASWLVPGDEHNAAYQNAATSFSLALSIGSRTIWGGQSLTIALFDDYPTGDQLLLEIIDPTLPGHSTPGGSPPVTQLSFVLNFLDFTRTAFSGVAQPTEAALFRKFSSVLFDLRAFDTREQICSIQGEVESITGVYSEFVPVGDAPTLAGFGSASFTANLDPVEWLHAAALTVPVALPNGQRVSGQLLVMNDTTDLYMALRVPWPPGPLQSSKIGFSFDSDHSGDLSLWDDLLLYDSAVGGVSDQVRTADCKLSGLFCGLPDSATGGWNSAAGIAKQDQAGAVWLFIHRLDSDESITDVHLHPGDTIAIKPQFELVSAEGIATTDFSDYLRLQILPPPAPAANYVRTVAGFNGPGRVDGRGGQAAFRSPNGGFVDTHGDIWIADTGNHQVRKMSPAGEVTTVAGKGDPGFADGPAETALFQSPIGVCVSGQTAYVADFGNHRVRAVSQEGIVSTVAGAGSGYVDGPARTARFNSPNDLVIDSAGNIFVTDFQNHAIRRISTDGQVSTWAGSGAPGYADAVGTRAQFEEPGGIAIDASGNLYVTEWGGHRVRKIAPDQSVTTLAGDGKPGLVDGWRGAARFHNPDGIAVAPDSSLIIVDNGNHAIRRLEPSMFVSTIAGTGAPGFVDGPGPRAAFHNPGGLGLGRDGAIYIVDSGNHAIRKLVTGTADLEGILVRKLPLDYVPGELLPVVLEVHPPPTVAAYALEEQPPSGWPIVDLSDSGIVDSQTGKVKFGPFFDTQPRALLYTVRVPSNESRRRLFAGLVSIDGAPVEAAGDREINLPTSSTARAEMPATFLPGEKLTVRIRVQPRPGVVAYALEDQPPAGWIVGSVSTGGFVDGSKVKWGPFPDALARVLSYEVTVPWGVVGPAVFNGTASFDGLNVPVGGARRPVLTAPPVLVAVVTSGGQLELAWEGNWILQRSEEVYGPWSDDLSAARPYVLKPGANRGFFRLRSP